MSTAIADAEVTSHDAIQPTSLDTLATEINAEHQACEDAARSAVHTTPRGGRP